MLRSFNCSGSLVLCEADFVGGLVGFELVIPVDFPIIHMTHRPRILAVAEGERTYDLYCRSSQSITSKLLVKAIDPFSAV